MVTGLTRVTVSAPHRRLDVALPDRAPVAEVLPELLRLSEPREHHPGTGGWMLRRAAGTALSAARDLPGQGVRDGDVLYLVPERLEWTEPEYEDSGYDDSRYDDPAEAVAAGAGHAAAEWSSGSTRVAALVAAALLLTAGAAVVLWRPGAGPVVPAGIAVALLLAAVVLPGRLGHRRAGAMLGWCALPYAFAAGAVWQPAGSGGARLAAGTAALLVAAGLGLAAGGVAAARTASGGVAPARTASGDGSAGYTGYVAGATVGLLGLPAAVAAATWSAPVAAAVLACVLVCGAGLLPALAIRFSGLPAPPVAVPPSAAARPGVTYPVVARARRLLTGTLVGWSVLAVAAVGTLSLTGGAAGKVLAAVTATALATRARLFASVPDRVALLAGAAAGYGLLVAVTVPGLPDVATAVLVVATAVVATAAAATGAGAGRSTVIPPARDPAGPPPSPYLARAAEVVETLAVVSVVPLAAAVTHLYGAVADLVS